jgi:Methyltransferase domain
VAIIDRLSETDRVLEVGAWSCPLPRADWVLDINPYETRGRYGYGPADRAAERFSDATWIERDACTPEPWPWEDDYFDFAVCAQTLEDLRDPVRVCLELQRVARAGYIEVPSRLEEQTRWLNGPWAGWSHHRWICQVRDGGIDFVAKGNLLDWRADLRVPRRVWSAAGAAGRIQSLWWQDRFDARELIFIEKGEFARWLADGVPVRGSTRLGAIRQSAAKYRLLLARAGDRVRRRGLSSHRERPR